MTDIDMAAEVTRYLDKLGTTRDEIRTALVDLKITGLAGSNVGCPLARYLRTALSDWHITVGNFEVSWGNPDYMIALPRCHREFIVDFDSGEYPELVAPDLLAGPRFASDMGNDAP